MAISLRSFEEKSEADRADWKAEMKALRKDFHNQNRNIENKLSAIGARCGINSEKSFRDGLEGILRDVHGIKVQRFQGFDKEGFVFRRPDQIELDIVVRDGVLILVEIKSSMSRNDVITFQRKIEWYEKEYDVKVARKVVISPMVDQRAADEIDYYGMEIFSGGREASI